MSVVSFTLEGSSTGGLSLEPLAPEEITLAPLGPPGPRGWSAVYAAVEDDGRALLQVVDWIGSEGDDKPEIGAYLGLEGHVEDIEDAFDFRGIQGFAGWSPVHGLTLDGTRYVLRVNDWIGGEGPKPATGMYVGAAGYVSNVADAVNIRGPQGLPGLDGENGWTAVEQAVLDGERIVRRIVDYAGGTGTKPTANIGKYLGASELVSDIAAALDFRGASGAGSDPVVFALVNASVAVVSGKAYRITATSAATLTLPASPATGDAIRIVDGETISATVKHVIARNGNTIMGLAQDMTLNVIGIDVTLWWNGSDWRLF